MLSGANCELGLEGRVELEEKQHEKVLGLAPDICAAIANIETAKQIGTAIHIMKQTCSKDTVTLLSRFGNCISYTYYTQRYITVVAKEEAEQEQDRVFCPFKRAHGCFHSVCCGQSGFS